MKPLVGIIALLLAWVGCRPVSRSPAEIAGVFRTQNPRTEKEDAPHYRQVELTADGFATWSIVDGLGRAVGVPTPKGRFTLRDEKIAFAVVKLGPNSDYEPPELIYEGSDRWRADGSNLLYLRVKGPNPPPATR